MPETLLPPSPITATGQSRGFPTLHKLFLDIGPGEKWRAYWKLRSGEFGRRLCTSITHRFLPTLH
jgi:hypothetical protein